MVKKLCVFCKICHLPKRDVFFTTFSNPHFIFPSDILHWVLPYEGDYERITLGMNSHIN